MKTSEVLRKAGDVLRKRGWGQHRYGNNDGGPRCVMGAVLVAAGKQSLDDDSIVRESRLALADLVESTSGSPAQWNDTAGRTVDEVLTAMDAAYVLTLQLEGIEPGDVL